jgi:Concanavalin A-like lectin/glucanases superfamily/Ig-like domain CHU_C associated
MKQRIFTLIAIICFAFSPLISEASHFRYGHITWTRTPGTRTVTFTITTAWRYDATESFDFNFGDGSSLVTGQLGTEILYVPNDYRVFQLQLTHTYATDAPFTASFNSCCRISTLQNGADGYFTVSSIVCLANNNLGSPVCTSPPIIEMTSGGNNQFQLVTSEPDGTPITYSAAAIQSDNYVPTVGSNIASVSPSGLISWNTTGSVSGQLYQMKVRMSDGCAESEIDFIIKIASCSSIPASVIVSGSPSTINLGQSANLTLTFNGTPPWVYRVSGTTTDITNSASPLTISVTPTSPGPNIITLSSVSNACGVGSVSGSVLVNVNPVLVACYPFNGDAQDSKGTNHGTVNGAVLTTDRFGNTNSAYSFDGTSANIQLNNASSFANSSYTYSAWVSVNNLIAFNVATTILSIGNSGGDQFFGQLNNSTTSGLGWHYGTSIGFNTVAQPPLVSYSSIVTNSWVHVAIVRTPSDRKMYINGQLAATNNATIPYYSTPIIATIGSRYNGVQPFNGKIDDVKIYNGVLNDNQVKALYLAEQSCPIVETGGVIAVTSLTSSPACVGGNVNVNIITNNITPTTGNPIIIQLSDVTGSFANPTQIGSGITNTIACSIPNTLTGGKYKVRAVYGTVISVNALSLTLNPRITTIPVISTPNTTICNTNSITIAATGCLIGTYVWTGGLTGSSITVTPTSTKSYKVACSLPPCLSDSSLAVTITVNPKPAAPSITTPNSTICSGLNQVLSATGCTGGTYTWTGGLSGSSVTVSPTTTKSYKAVCTINNCSSDSSGVVTITVNPKPATPTISTPNATICNGGSTILTASGCIGGSYTWSTGLVSASISVSPTVTRTYQVMCRVNNCSSDSSAAFTVTVSPKPGIPSITTNNPTVCSGVSTALTASGCIGGTYAWTGGLTGSSITVSPNTTKSYKAVCIVNTCSSDSSVATTITVTSSVASPVTTPASICEGNSITVGNGLKSTVPNCSATGNSTTASYAGGIIGYDGGLSSGSNPIATTSGISGTITKVAVASTWTKKGGGDHTTCGTAHNAGDPSLFEMSLKLQAPDGTQVVLVPANTYQGSYVGNITTTFDDASALTLSSTPLAGAVKPSGLLSSLNGKSPNGTWTLIPNDNGGGDPLCVAGFSVTITTTAAVNASTVTWWDAPTGGNQVGTGAEYIPATSLLTAGTYTYYAQASCSGVSCPSSRIGAVLTVNPRLSTPTITPLNAIICIGNSTTLTASGCSVGSTYSWTGGLTGSSVSVSPNTTKSYKVACSLNNCTSDSSAVATITVATSMYSILSGKWDLATTWSCGRVPTSNDNVTISTGHTVTVRDAFAKAKNLSNNGVLVFATSTSKLMLGTGPVAPTTITLTLQPNATDGKDVVVASGNPTGNYANVTYIHPYAGTNSGSPVVNRVLIGFDLSTIPSTAIVDSAYLTLYYNQTVVNLLNPFSSFFDGHAGDNQMYVQRITQPWLENTVTWNNQPAISIVNQLSVPVFAVKNQNYKFDVKTLTQDMVVSPTTSHGFMIRLQNEIPYKLTALSSSDEPNANLRPKFQVYYHLP